MNKLLGLMSLLLSVSGFGATYSKPVVSTPFRTLDSIDPARDREYVSICTDGRCSFIVSVNNNLWNTLNIVEVFTTHADVPEVAQANDILIPNPESIYRVDYATFSYMAARSTKVDTALRNRDDNVGWNVLGCVVATGASCGSTLISVFTKGPDASLAAIGSCFGATAACERAKQAYRKEIAYWEAIEAENKENGLGAAQGDSQGGSGTGTSGNPPDPGGGTAAPIEVPHQGDSIITEPKDGTPGGGTSCSKIPKPIGCDRPPAKEK